MLGMVTSIVMVIVRVVALVSDDVYKDTDHVRDHDHTDIGTGI